MKCWCVDLRSTDAVYLRYTASVVLHNNRIFMFNEKFKIKDFEFLVKHKYTIIVSTKKYLIVLGIYLPL